MKTESRQNRSESTSISIDDAPKATVSRSDCRDLTQAAKTIALEHHVSLRTAYRHLARGSRPELERCIGRDGKTYPAYPRGWRPNRTALQRELALTWQALNRADKKANKDGIHDDDVASLRRIASMAQGMLNCWEAVE